MRYVIALSFLVSVVGFENLLCYGRDADKIDIRSIKAFPIEESRIRDLCRSFGTPFFRIDPVF